MRKGASTKKTKRVVKAKTTKGTAGYSLAIPGPLYAKLITKNGGERGLKSFAIGVLKDAV